MLSIEQLKQFNTDGYLLLKQFAPSELIVKIRSKAEELIKNPIHPIETEEGYHRYDNSTVTLRRLRQVYDRDPIFASWMTSKTIRPILKQILQDIPVLTLAHHNSIMTKMPSKISNTCWHQDRRYWNFQNDNLVSIWLALGKETLENGVLEFIPGSHKMKFERSQFDDKLCFKNDNKENMQVLKKRVHFDLSAGDVVIFHCHTLHSAFNNKTGKPKLSFVYTVRGKSNLPLLNTNSSNFKEINL